MRSQTPLAVILTLLIVYFSTFGATFNGMLIPELRWMTFFILIGAVALWWGVRMRAKWVWHNTPLDAVLVLWGVAIGISFLVNMDVWRKSATAIWFVTGYILAWYLITDWLANKALRRQTLIDACLMGGLVIVFFGYFQFITSLSRGEIARVGSLVGNPNSLGAYLIILLTLALGRIFTIKKGVGRWILGVYALIITVLLAITFSRGAWIGMAVSLMVLIGLHLPVNFRTKIASQSRSIKLALGFGTVMVALIGTVGGIIILQSFGEGGRSLGLRTDIYSSAYRIFADEPLIGHGLFTFGGEFARMQSQPPRQPHSHAHNGVLLVMAELGLVGLITLIISVVMALWTMWRNWRQAEKQDRGFLAIGMAGSIGFGVHHLFDFPAMMPLIALSGVLVLLLALIPPQSAPIKSSWRLLGHPIAMAVYCVGFLLFGGWSSGTYSQYTAILAQPFAQEPTMTYSEAGDALQAVIDAGPAMMLYSQQQAYLYALAGDYDRAIIAYERFLSSETTHSITWANVASLYWETGQPDRAIEAQTRAVRLSTEVPQFRFALARYLETQGDEASARVFYQQSLGDFTSLWVAWEQTPLSREVFAELSLSDSHQLTVALDENLSDDLDTLWRGSSYAQENNTRAKMLRLIVALRRGEAIDTIQLIIDGRATIENRMDEAWLLLGQAELARFVGDADGAEVLLAQARAMIAPQFGREDIVFATNVPYFQFLSSVIPRQLLPTVFYPMNDSALARLLD